MALLLWLLLIVPLVKGEINTPASPEEVPPDVLSLTASVIAKLDPTGISEGILDEVADAKMEETLAKILDQVTHVSTQINDLRTRLDSKLSVMVEEIALHQEKFALMSEFKIIYQNINYFWKEYLKVLRHRSLHKNTYDRFVSTMIDLSPDSPAANLNNLENLINGNSLSNRVPTLPKALLKYYKTTEGKRCTPGTSDQLDIYYLYNIISVLEKQVMIMSVYAYTRKVVMKENYSVEMRQLTIDFQKRMAQYNETMLATMANASNMIRACHPEDGFKRGVSFAEMEGAVQTLVINEAQLYKFTDLECYGNCEQRRGQLDNTELRYVADFIDNCRSTTDGFVNICPSDEESPRMYNWLEMTYSERQCPYRIDRVENYGLGPICETCLCRAYNLRKTNREPRVSLLPATSDYTNNMVVTGVKIHYHKNIVQLQVQEGKLGPAGQIFQSSTRWVPINESGDYSNVYNSDGEERKLPRKTNDYVIITEWERTVNLEYIDVPKNHVIVGVRFGATVRKPYAIYLKALSIPFDYKTGRLQPMMPAWYTAGDYRKKKIKFDNPDISVNNPMTVLRGGADIAVDFQESGTMDYGQSTIPFWDIQEVVTSPSVPLQGIGLIHKGDKDGRYGGFLALAVNNLDPALHFKYQTGESVVHHE